MGVLKLTGTLNEHFAMLSNGRSPSRADESFLSPARDPGHETFQLNYTRADITKRLDGFSSSASWPNRRLDERFSATAFFPRGH